MNVVNLFQTAKSIPPKSKPRKKGGGGGGGGGGGASIFMRLNIARKAARELADANIKLRAENERLQATVKRLQQENDALWASAPSTPQT